ncbi:hypothetical protein MIB92_15450 [Aestuariirhabdus sp. Z084]|uniref:AsmA family protein n=1 Tax=Aestuariirhabdus haliotis TaxID=2918751 RepID=UPI00201B43DC|nr:AsmA family protein [Aestuariirhabdus haliotis]MCL6417056.1 hypothetical protein [Aestuariirhabdus haliotis]MCL6420967.1 hypothetical protein [Aestuariirhabdus haliotis]
MKLVKIALGVVVAMIAVIALVAFLGLQNINEIIKVAVETAGPKVTGTPVVLNKVELSLTEGRGDLFGLQIDNPAGYQSDYAFSMGQVALQVEPASLAGDVIVINEVLVDGAKLIAEQKDLTHNNIQDILNHVKKAGGGKKSAQDSASSSSETESSGAEKEVRLMIEKFSFTNSGITLMTEQLGEHSLSMADIKLNNIGDRKTGLTPEQLTQALLDPILAQATDNVVKHLEGLAKEKATKALEEKLDENLNEKQKGQLDQLKGLFK